MNYSFRELCTRIAAGIPEMPITWKPTWMDHVSGQQHSRVTEARIYATGTVIFEDDNVFGQPIRVTEILLGERVTEMNVKRKVVGLSRLHIVTEYHSWSS